jgi:hypothetical protein
MMHLMVAQTPRKPSGNRREGVYTKRLHKQPVGLCQKRGVHYRRRVPTDLRTILGKREIWRSLETDSFSAAVRRIHRAAAGVEGDLKKLGSALV